MVFGMALSFQCVSKAFPTSLEKRIRTLYIDASSVHRA
ncbi:MAG: hypothetical protein BSOLF_2647 [Candidatus Carbobacillus altaicus]|uniref:Uncharacterized protein n=1 Tax=Candidatus Carbonibacillus altaicus TaxID=2163959 RepID=A0A2R6Y2H4_9BACL|nr:MAG: hypothetical protein BSOLF_2647 [Candidatus Carbobacillus altaicus]